MAEQVPDRGRKFSTSQPFGAGVTFQATFIYAGPELTPVAVDTLTLGAP